MDLSVLMSAAAGVLFSQVMRGRNRGALAALPLLLVWLAVDSSIASFAATELVDPGDVPDAHLETTEEIVAAMLGYSEVWIRQKGGAPALAAVKRCIRYLCEHTKEPPTTPPEDAP